MRLQAVLPDLICQLYKVLQGISAGYFIQYIIFPGMLIDLKGHINLAIGMKNKYTSFIIVQDILGKGTMAATNNITRFLDSRKIKYTAHEMPTEKLGAVEAAQFMGVAEDQVF